MRIFTNGAIHTNEEEMKEIEKCNSCGKRAKMVGKPVCRTCWAKDCI